MSSGRDGDIIWSGVDPLGRTVHELRSVNEARAGKHAGADAISADEVHGCVTTPSFIDRSSQNETRYNYYRDNPIPGRPPFDRVTVSFGDSILAPDGVVISCSKYRKPVRGERVYTREAGDEDAET